MNEDKNTTNTSHLDIRENTIINNAKPLNYAEIDDFIDDKLMINSIETPVEQINLQIIQPEITRNEQRIDNTTLLSPLKQLCFNSLGTPIIQSQNSNAFESTDNLTPPPSNLHFTAKQSPVQQNNTLNYTDITPINTISLANPLQNTLHPGISFTNGKTNRENEHQVLKITDHAIKPTDTLVLHTDNFLLLHHNPTPIENNSLFQNTFNVSRREELYAKRRAY
jgi:hypothetical protein